VLAAEHLLDLRGIDLVLDGVERALEVAGHVLAGPRPFEQHAEVVELPGKAVAQLEIFSETALALERLLGFGLVVPEIGRADFAFELG
jgi:hypothetical protein